MPQVEGFEGNRYGGNFRRIIFQMGLLSAEK